MRYTLEKLRKSTIHNTDAQPGVLVSRWEALHFRQHKAWRLYSGHFWGNHDNKTSKDITRDEATAVAGQITAYLDGAKRSLGFRKLEGPQTGLHKDGSGAGIQPRRDLHAQRNAGGDKARDVEQRDQRGQLLGEGEEGREIHMVPAMGTSLGKLSQRAWRRCRHRRWRKRRPIDVKTLPSAVAPNNNLTGYHRTEITPGMGRY